LSFSYKIRFGESASQGLRPEGLEAVMRRVLHYKGGPGFHLKVDDQGRPFFVALKAALV
jgi:hypothetical protein